MSGIIEWDDRFSVGIEEIDRQHKQLFNIIDIVFEGIGELDDDKGRLREAFDKVIDYTKYHFETEERYFAVCGYPDAEEHKKQHARLLEETLELKRQYTEGAPGITFEMIDFLTQWLQKHILLHDKQYAPFVRKWKEEKAPHPKRKKKTS